MKILVTGGAGFIGSHICLNLLNQGHQVICLDNFYTGNKENLIQCLERSEFEIVEQDVQEPFFYELDQIYHLACPASPVYYQKEPIQTLRTSFLGTLNVLECARKTGARVLFTSTSEVYGDPLEHPQKESYWGNVNPVGIRSCYDEGKRVAESLLLEYRRKYDLEIKIARIFNTYGPNMQADDGRVISNFVTQAIKGESLTIYGDGSQTRSFCYVDDMVSGLIALMESPKEFWGPCNLGNPGEFSILELIDLIKEVMDNSLDVSFMDLPQDDPKKRRPNIDLAKKHLGFQPKIVLKLGNL